MENIYSSPAYGWPYVHMVRFGIANMVRVGFGLGIRLSRG